MSTERHGRILDELNEAIGKWNPPNGGRSIGEEPTEEPSPWEGLTEGDYTIEPFKEKEVSGLDEKSSLTDEEWETLGGAVRENGTDAVAYYKSFRFRGKDPFPGKWGIFYLAEGVQYISEIISYYIRPHFPFDLLAHKFLKTHEMYHFKIDALSLYVEPPMRQHLWLPFRYAYRNYQSKCIEEALANVQAWNWAKKEESKFKDLLEFAEDFMDVQPNAYARYQEDHFDLAAELAENLVNQKFGKSKDESVAMWLIDSAASVNYRVPEYVVRDVDISRLYSKVVVIPPVTQIVDAFSKSLDTGLQQKWSKTKTKLIEAPALRGLNFKPWMPKGVWSVKVDRGYRAHLRNIGNGQWEAFEIGTHDQMGH